MYLTQVSYIHETIYVSGQYLKHNTCIVLQYMYCVTSPQCVPSFTLQAAFICSPTQTGHPLRTVFESTHSYSPTHL